MPARLILLALSALFFSASCTPVRTVYDSQGNEIREDDEPGGEKDLISTFEKRFDAAFSEQQSEDGVPRTVSSKVSSFQQELDNARRTDTPFATGRFDTGKNLDLRNSGFADSGKRFSTNKDGIEKTANSMYSRDLRPDFMNENHGISRNTQYSGASADHRSSLEGMNLSDRSKTHYLNDSIPYSTEQGNHYVEERRNKTEQPTIIDYQEYYRQHRNSVRQLLGRDNEPQ